MADYRVIVADSTDGVRATAIREQATIVSQIREFDEIDTAHDASLGDVGRLFTTKHGYVALAKLD